jgi:hypothetical protein
MLAGCSPIPTCNLLPFLEINFPSNFGAAKEIWARTGNQLALRVNCIDRACPYHQRERAVPVLPCLGWVRFGVLYCQTRSNGLRGVIGRDLFTSERGLCLFCRSSVVYTHGTRTRGTGKHGVQCAVCSVQSAPSDGPNVSRSAGPIGFVAKCKGQCTSRASA